MKINQKILIHGINSHQFFLISFLLTLILIRDQLLDPTHIQ